jgi:hypothetical protein
VTATKWNKYHPWQVYASCLQFLLNFRTLKLILIFYFCINISDTIILSTSYTSYEQSFVWLPLTPTYFIIYYVNIIFDLRSLFRNTTRAWNKGYVYTRKEGTHCCKLLGFILISIIVEISFGLEYIHIYIKTLQCCVQSSLAFHPSTCSAGTRILFCSLMLVAAGSYAFDRYSQCCFPTASTPRLHVLRQIACFLEIELSHGLEKYEWYQPTCFSTFKNCYMCW